jgi:hypothetical protein
LNSNANSHNFIPVILKIKEFMRLSTLYYSIVLFTLLQSCSPKLRPFTQNLWDTHKWEEEDLQKIQFYVSEDIILHRFLSGESSEIINGEIKIVEGRKVEEIRIPHGTPGVYTFSPKKERLAISFEEDKYLIFGPNPKRRDSYVLLASSWERNKGIVTYDDRKFTTPTKSAFSTLMIDIKHIDKTDSKVRIVKGRKVD